MSFAPLVRLWLWVSAFASAAGWTLSAFGHLNHAGYAIAIAAFVIFIVAGRKGLGLVPGGKIFSWKKVLRRFRRLRQRADADFIVRRPAERNRIKRSAFGREADVLGREIKFFVE